MRADRLVSIVLLLRRHQRMSATALADELEVSTRTVLRDIEALSTAGVPIHAERGRHGGFVLLPDFRTDLTGLNRNEALALLVAGSRRGAEVFGLGTALASAMHKVIAALPGNNRDTATAAIERLLVDPDTDLFANPVMEPGASDEVMADLRAAVLEGSKVRIQYAAVGKEPAWRTIDPIGLVSVRERGYLLATHDGADRTYRLSRILAAEQLPDRADRAEQVDLTRAWNARGQQFQSAGEHLTVPVRLPSDRREELVRRSVTVSGDTEQPDGWILVDAVFQGAKHAEWALWQLSGHAEALGPAWLRERVRRRAVETLERYASDEPTHHGHQGPGAGPGPADQAP